MPKKWLKKYLPNPEQIRANKSLNVLGTLLHDANLWHLNRRSVAGAVAVGLFFCYIPIPLQMLQAAILAIILRVNLPISVSMVWVTNPFTIPPMFYIAYSVGALLLGVEPQSFQFEFSLNWIFTELGARWRPFLLGCLVMAGICSITGYFTTLWLWRLHLVQRIKERKLLHLSRKKESNA
ncbi:MAG: DUF2062 domain-containing protein [Gammaproteobacteria bacterium]|nr:DUF2062 domain-containing protein [Gammaproteobacteria bacterium]